MPDTTILAELDGQHAELLPARTVLSLLSAEPSIDGKPGIHGLSGLNIPSSGLNTGSLSAPLPNMSSGGSANGG